MAGYFRACGAAIRSRLSAQGVTPECWRCEPANRTGDKKGRANASSLQAKHQQNTSSFGEFCTSLKAGGDGKPQANRFRDRKGNSAHTNSPHRH